MHAALSAANTVLIEKSVKMSLSIPPKVLQRAVLGLLAAPLHFIACRA